MNYNTAILTALLQKLEQPYTVEDNMLIIEPTSSSMLEILPGKPVSVGDGYTNLHVDLNTIDTIEWMSGVCNIILKLNKL